MRATGESAEFKLAAYAGTYVVVLAWDTVDGQRPVRANLLGFGIERVELDAQGDEVERYWMRSIKRFKDKDKGLPPGTPVSTADHPIQSFQWADYTAKAGTRYRYRVVPVYGTVKNSRLDEAAASTQSASRRYLGWNRVSAGNGPRASMPRARAASSAGTMVSISSRPR